jgi:2-phosphosulfolactate phosphatase
VVSSEPAKIFVHLLPTLIPPGSLCGGIAVVVDVLRATTVMVHALAAGCESVIPCGEIEEAKDAVARLPAGTAVLGGERGGLPIPGFDVGNSPREFTPEVCRGKTVIMTTTNGTRAILASLGAARVYIASFANLGATSDEIAVPFLKRDHGQPVHIVCAGTEGFVSWEDSLLAGALVDAVAGQAIAKQGDNVRLGNDGAFIVLSQWRESERHLKTRPLWWLLSVGRGGQNVQQIGLQSDIDDAAHLDRFRLVAEVCRDPLRIVAV